MDRYQARLIISWVEKNLLNTDNPRRLGKALKGNYSEYWRYRIGNYRLIVDIQDEEILILILDIGHRKDIYQ